tara:strand:+ start:594 stop:797 length:204 start_codon:yes stop_codon:yes gene_type:complete
MPIGSKYPVDKGITNGKPTHVPNKDGNLYGDYTKMSQSEYGSRPKKGVTLKWEDKAWKYPSPTKGKR